jgi:hypothetical protein
MLLVISIVATATTSAESEDSGDKPRTSLQSPVSSLQDPTSQGIRKLTGKYITLFTDVPSSPEVDRLPEVFDAAVPQWAEYFGIDLSTKQPWQARGYLVGDRRRFESLHLLPLGHEDFVNGVSMGAELWFVDQPTAYYRRHLMLHEGTHVFMASFLGGCGPGWYMEGMAELFATHRWDDKTNRLAMRIMPASREEVPMLGRIKLIRDAFADGKRPTLGAIMQTDNTRQLGNEAYAWCWAAAKLLDTNPRYRERFHGLYKNVLDRNFNQLMRTAYADDWSQLNEEWQALIATLDHGFDFDRMAVDFNSHGLVSEGGQFAHTIGIDADRGWQSSGYQLEAGRSYKITAKGRYQIAAEKVDGVDRTWPCEPGGVTIEYHDGHPLGMLLGAVVSDATAPTDEMSFCAPVPIGLKTMLKPKKPGTLFLRVNETANGLADNRGSLSIVIVPEYTSRSAR